MEITIDFRFSYDELSAAVKEQYCQDEATVKHYIMLEVEYFEARLKVRIETCFLMRGQTRSK